MKKVKLIDWNDCSKEGLPPRSFFGAILGSYYTPELTHLKLKDHANGMEFKVNFIAIEEFFDTDFTDAKFNLDSSCYLFHLEFLCCEYNKSVPSSSNGGHIRSLKDAGYLKSEHLEESELIKLVPDKERFWTQDDMAYWLSFGTHPISVMSLMDKQDERENIKLSEKWLHELRIKRDLEKIKEEMNE
jgi:hypothetical protein